MIPDLSLCGVRRRGRVAGRDLHHVGLPHDLAEERLADRGETKIPGPAVRLDLPPVGAGPVSRSADPADRSDGPWFRGTTTTAGPVRPAAPGTGTAPPRLSAGPNSRCRLPPTTLLRGPPRSRRPWDRGRASRAERSGRWGHRDGCRTSTAIPALGGWRRPGTRSPPSGCRAPIPGADPGYCYWFC